MNFKFIKRDSWIIKKDEHALKELTCMYIIKKKLPSHVKAGIRISGGCTGTKGVARYRIKNGNQHATKPPTTTARVPAVFVSLATLLMQLCWLPRIVPNFLHMLVGSVSSDGLSHVTLLSAQSVRCTLMLFLRSICQKRIQNSAHTFLCN